MHNASFNLSTGCITGREVRFLLPGEESVVVQPGEELGEAGVSEGGQQPQQEEGVLGNGGGERALAGEARAPGELQTDAHRVHQTFPPAH